MRPRTLVPAVAFVGALLFFTVAASPLISLVPPVHAQSGAPVFDSSANYTRSIDENKGPYDTSGGGTPSQADHVLIGDPVKAAGAGITYTLDNGGASDFGIDYFTGQLLVGNPLDYEEKSSHTVTVIAVNSSGTARQDVTINVNNLDEPGKLTLMWKPSGSDVEFEAKLSDGDVITGDPAWQWAESDSQNGTYTNISSATSATYTNSPDHEYLKATATYTDSHGSGKTVSAVVNAKRPSNLEGYTLEFNVTTSGGYACPHRSTGTNYNNENADLCLNISRNATPEDNIYYPANLKYTHDTERDRSPSPGTISYSLSGDDAAKFDIDPTNGDLFPKGAHQYNSPGSDEVFLVTITATHPSGEDGGSDSVDIALKPSGSNTNPVIQGPRRIRYPENGTWQVAQYTAAFSNSQQTVGWIISVEPGGGDGDFFDIDDNGVLSFTQRPDYEHGQREFRFHVQAYATNGPRGSTYYSVRVIVYDVDEDLEIRGPTVVEFPENSTGPIHTYTAEGTEGRLTWMLEGQDKQWFSLSSSGALSFRSTPDYEAPFDSRDAAKDQNDYLLSITVMDDNGTTDTADDDTSKIEPVRVMVTNVNEPPSFDEGSTATRSVSENAESGEDIGDAVEATDPDASDPLTYDLTGSGDDASFDIGAYDGQLRTISGVDYGSKSRYTVTITVTDGGGLTDEITVTVNSTEVNDPPVFDDTALTTTLSLPENTAPNTSIGSAITATDEDNPSLAYTLEGTTSDKDAFTIDSSGQIKTKSGVTYNYEKPGDADTNNDYQITVKASDGNSSDTIDVTITVSDLNETPAFDENSPATRSIQENTPANADIGAAISATDPDNENGRSGDTLTYTLGGTDAASFGFDTATGQIKTKAALDKETKSSYSVTVTVRDSRNANGDSDTVVDATITVNITVTGENEPPGFDANLETTLEVAENTAPNTNIGSAITASDEDNDSLTYTLEGTDASSFQIGSTSGQIKTKTGVTYDFEDPGDADNNGDYEVTVKADDKNGGTDTIRVTIDLTNVNEPPEFDEGSSATRSVSENAEAGEDIGDAVEAADPDAGDSLSYDLTGSGDDASFDIGASDGQLQTISGVDYGSKSRYAVTITVTDGGGLTDEITVTINSTEVNDPPVFTDATTSREVPENSPAGTSVGAPVTATDEDNPSLSYTLEGADKDSFTIDDNGQIKTKTGVAYDYESTKSTYQVTVKASDGSSSDTVDVTIDLTNADDAGTVAFDPDPPEAGTALYAAAQDEDGGITGETWKWYSSTRSTTGFSVISGQISSAYTPTAADVGTYLKAEVSYTDDLGSGKSAEGTTPAVVVGNTPPRFTDTNNDGTPDPITFTVDENSSAGTLVGTVSATDADIDTLSYSLGGDSNQKTSFEEAFTLAITGAITVKADGSLDFEAEDQYSFQINVYDGRDAADQPESPSRIDATVSVTINVTNLDEDGTVTFDHPQPEARSALTATLADPDIVSGTPSWQWSKSDTEDGTFSEINNATSASYTPADSEVNKYLKATATYRDKQGGLTVTRTASGVADNPVQAFHNPNEAPAFPGADNPPVFTIEENTSPGEDIGTVSATDPNNEAVAYSLDKASAKVFAIGLTSGLIQTKGPLDYESKNTYAVTVFAKDPQMLTGMMTVTINVTDVDDPGTVSFSSTQPRVQSAFTATLNDQDSDRANESWQWALSDTTHQAGGYTDIANAASATYTPVTGDQGKYLKATVTYNDKFGTNNSVEAVEGPVTASVVGPPLQSLSVHFGDSGYTVPEGETATITVLLSSPADRSVQVPVRVIAGTAEPEDYSVSATGVTFGTGATLRTFTITAEQDGDTDAETLSLGFGTLPNGVAAGSPATATLTINDDDTRVVSNLAVTYSSSSYSVTEGSAATITVQLYPAPTQSVTIPVTAGGGTAESADYTVSAGSVTFGPAITSQTFTITAEQDGDTDAETLSLGFGTLPNGVAAGSPSSATLTINDDDTPAAQQQPPPASSGTVSFSAANYAVTEGGTATITVQLSPAPTQSVTIPVTASGGTAEPEDYSVSATSVTFGTGATSGTLAITTEHDDDSDAETLTLGFGTLPNGVAAGSPSTATLTINDDDTPVVNNQPPPRRRSGLTRRGSRRGSGGGISDEQRPPVFMEGPSTTRWVPEDTLAGVNIGFPVWATDPNQDPLTYALVGGDRTSFAVDPSTGQLSTSAPLDYENKADYSVTMIVTDGRGGKDSIVVFIAVTDVGDLAYDPATKTVALITVEDGASITTPDGSGSVVFPAATRNVPYYACIGQGSGDCARDAPEGDLHVYTTVDIFDMGGNLLGDLTLEQPVTILLRVNAADLGGLERALQIHEYGGFKAYTRTDSSEDWAEVDFTLFSSDTGAITVFITGIRHFSCFVVVVDASVLPPPVIQVIAAPGPTPTPVAEPPPQAEPVAPTPGPPAAVVKQGQTIYPPVAQPEEADDPFGTEAPFFTFRTMLGFAKEIPPWLLIVLAIAAGAWAAILRAYVAWRRNNPPPPKYRSNKPQLGRDLLAPGG